MNYSKRIDQQLVRIRMNHPAIPTTKLFLKISKTLTLLTLSIACVHAEEAGDLFTHIQTLQNEHQIEISGLEKISNTQIVSPGGNLEQQVKQLFAGYNHIVTRTPKGKIQRIVIISKKEKTTHRRMVLPTSQQGRHYTVEVMLTGDGKSWQTLDMIIDTGADLVVLPVSLIDQVGLSGHAFKHATLQTANGVADAKIVKLQELRIAGESLDNVEAAFIEDRLLGGNKLLGMSVLGKFQINIDDTSQLITFIKK